MSTDATNATATPEASDDKSKKKRTRKAYRLGVTMPLAEYPIPDGGLSAVPEDWDINSHKELRGDDFDDILTYFQWVKSYANSLLSAADAKVQELEAFGDADTRREMSEIFGNTASVAAQIAKESVKEGLTQEQKEAMAAKVKEILGDALQALS